MTEISKFFLKNFENVAKKMTREQQDNFFNVKTDFERVKLLYALREELTIPTIDYGKDYGEAEKLKAQGNAYYGKKNFHRALNCYNEGLLKCPLVSLDNKKLYCLLLANRSACLYSLSQFEKCIEDINLILSLSDYPKESLYKIYFRKAKCLAHKPSEKIAAEEAYKLAVSHLDLSTLSKSAIKKEQDEMAKEISKLNNISKISTSAITKTICKDVVLNDAIMTDYQEELGRFVRAAKQISCGATIINEPAYCAVLSENFTSTNCYRCMLATNVPVICKTCAYAVYCSTKCQSDAASYHKYECGLLGLLLASGISINCFMALRIITQRTARFFKEFFGKLPNADFSTEDEKAYLHIHNLCRNENSRKQEEYFQYTLMGIFLTLLLQEVHYFDDDKLTPDTELVIASLLSRHIQALQFNAHEISELQEAPPGPMDPPDEPNFKAIYIGGGLFPSLAMFNHSCDPSIVRYNIGSKVIVKTIKPIQKGEIIYENYGPIYTNSPLDERKKYLAQRYWFDCKCKACEEGWPLFTNMKDQEVNIRCDKRNCQGYFVMHENLDSDTQVCSSCKNQINVFMPLLHLSKLEQILSVAEQHYKNKKYEEAQKEYLKAMTVYCQYTVPPFPDWVKVQQRLRTCMVSKGNKSIECQATIN